MHTSLHYSDRGGKNRQTNKTFGWSGSLTSDSHGKLFWFLLRPHHHSVWLCYNGSYAITLVMLAGFQFCSSKIRLTVRGKMSVRGYLREVVSKMKKVLSYLGLILKLVYFEKVLFHL